MLKDAYIVSPGVKGEPFEFPLDLQGMIDAMAKAITVSMSVPGVQKIIKRQGGKSRETQWYKGGKRL